MAVAWWLGAMADQHSTGGIVKLSLIAQLHAAGLPEPSVEFRFVPRRKFAFDLAWEGTRLAVEVEGGLFGRGKKCPLCGRRRVAGHSSIQRLKSDMEKYNLAATLGWAVIRVTPDDVDSGAALRWIERAFELRRQENEAL